MKKLLLSIVLIFISNTALADDYDIILNKALELIETNRIEEGIDFIYSTNKWIDSSNDAVVNLKNQLANITPLVGKYRYKEKLAETWMGSRYVHIVYAFGYDRQPLRLQFELYNPTGQKWFFNSFSFDSNLTDGLEKFTNDNLYNKKP